jgi:5-hydroxyisourate hydrolase-like protein (transthyretin family)
MKKHIASILLSVFITSFFIGACEKQAPDCTGNCGSINANGIVIDSVSGLPAAGVPVKLDWAKYNSTSLRIITAYSGSDGRFNFTCKVDTTYFTRGYKLAILDEATAKYMYISGASINYPSFSFDTTAFKDVRFEVYTKATLQLKVNRSLHDHFVDFSIEHFDFTNLGRFDYGDDSIGGAGPTSPVLLTVAADTTTRFRMIKIFSFNPLVSDTTYDSIRCTLAGPNIYTVNY